MPTLIWVRGFPGSGLFCLTLALPATTKLSWQTTLLCRLTAR